MRAAVRDLDQHPQERRSCRRRASRSRSSSAALATLRYQRGLASNFDVVDAEGSLVLARSALVSLLTRYQVARIELMRVTGALDVDASSGPWPPRAAPQGEAR
mgnify:CR=1 FL=1